MQDKETTGTVPARIGIIPGMVYFIRKRFRLRRN
jgi:hypothetical protein